MVRWREWEGQTYVSALVSHTKPPKLEPYPLTIRERPISFQQSWLALPFACLFPGHVQDGVGDEETLHLFSSCISLPIKREEERKGAGTVPAPSVAKPC